MLILGCAWADHRSGFTPKLLVRTQEDSLSFLHLQLMCRKATPSSQQLAHLPPSQAQYGNPARQIDGRQNHPFSTVFSQRGFYSDNLLFRSCVWAVHVSRQRLWAVSTDSLNSFKGPWVLAGVLCFVPLFGACVMKLWPSFLSLFSHVFLSQNHFFSLQ